MLRVNIVLNQENNAWIIEKIAMRLCEHAGTCGVDAKLSDRADPAAEINHWMSYAFANEKHTTPTTMFITHFDDPYKIALIKSELRNGVDVGICMSSHAVQELIRHGAPSESLCFVLPAHDNQIVPHRTVIGLTTRLYPDGRKREDLLVRLATDMPLTGFKFCIYGAGWEAVVPKLEKAGAEVEYKPGGADFRQDYAEIVRNVPNFDYYLYMGLDEGSLGTLDALAAGVQTIVTSQGFHRDLNDAVTHFFQSYEELLAVFRTIDGARRRRIAAAEDLTWPKYAGRHATIWRAIVAGDKDSLQATLTRQKGAQVVPSSDYLELSTEASFYLRALSPRRIRSALSHHRYFKPLRRWIRKQ